MSAFLAVALLAGQPVPKLPDGPVELPMPKPAYTAFPDLKPPPMPWTDPGWKGDLKEARAAYDKAMEELVFVKPPALPADPTPLQKVRHEQVRAGLDYLRRVQEVIAVGRVDAVVLADYFKAAAEVYKVAAELDGTPAGRARCYEARVVLMKEIERLVGARAAQGLDPPQQLDLARFQRLQAEADLLRLREEVEKAGKK